MYIFMRIVFIILFVKYLEIVNYGYQSAMIVGIFLEPPK